WRESRRGSRRGSRRRSNRLPAGCVAVLLGWSAAIQRRFCFVRRERPQEKQNESAAEADTLQTGTPTALSQGAFGKGGKQKQRNKSGDESPHSKFKKPRRATLPRPHPRASAAGAHRPSTPACPPPGRVPLAPVAARRVAGEVPLA